MAKAKKIAPSACIGDLIEWQSIMPKEKRAIKRGKVLKIYDNSVLVEIAGGDQRTVIANKRYKVIEGEA